MDDDELNEVFGELVQILRDGGLGWIVEQVEAEISVGRLYDQVSRGRKPPKDPRLSGAFTREDYFQRIEYGAGKSPERADIASVPFSALERVQSLVRAVRRVIRDSDALEDYLNEFRASTLVRDSAGGPMEIFVADDDSSERRAMYFIGDGDVGRSGRSVLLQLLEDLEREMAGAQ